jgi:hypothetical protein
VDVHVDRLAVYADLHAVVIAVAGLEGDLGAYALAGDDGASLVVDGRLDVRAVSVAVAGVATLDLAVISQMTFSLTSSPQKETSTSW